MNNSQVNWQTYLGRLCRQVLVVSFVSFVVFSLVEYRAPGLVSAHLNPNRLLMVLILSALGDAYFRER